MTISRTQAEWDAFWLGLAQYVSTVSKDPSTKCGAVIVRPDNSVAAIGYNGFPRKMPDNPQHYEDRAEKYARIIHCEMNAHNAMKEPADDCTLYTWPFLTCDRCAVHMIQAGIVRVVAPQATPQLLERWGDTFVRARGYYADCGVECCEL